MTKARTFSPAAFAGRLPVVAAALGVAILVTGCADRVVTGSVPDDYRTRHPIVVAEGQKSIDIPVARSDDGLTRGQREVIAGFVDEYRRASTGIIQIMTPKGSINDGAAASAAGEVRRLMVRMGVPKSKILHVNFAAGPGEPAPLRLTYSAVTAQTSPCGEWPADMTLNTSQNDNYYNFGCASQRNLAAQIANPHDLLGPRRMTPPDAEQRGKAMDRYRDAYVELKDMGD
ncbi:pilus assembly protein CpaD [Rhizobiales bacterium RZME27]|uniref:Pilus assembly protein CpaD n=1 Tax=Endobacterium cereale TaxID=2663029 RepID=A0A6A8A6G6_9HYPH|nr:CpaD family pilus assembly lipoprotein [Endobacterium cereale]MEB2844954.1 CpaD family pilus assembly lipoprotein [Endobacterium cereale]MQY44866.1 pilus assembly protein CpaD [Endobacterium cereale]